MQVLASFQFTMYINLLIIVSSFETNCTCNYTLFKVEMVALVYRQTVNGRLYDIKVKISSCAFLRSYYVHIVKPNAFSTQRSFVKKESV